jgi:hypothetical protein
MPVPACIVRCYARLVYGEQARLSPPPQPNAPGRAVSGGQAARLPPGRLHPHGGSQLPYVHDRAGRSGGVRRRGRLGKHPDEPVARARAARGAQPSAGVRRTFVNPRDPRPGRPGTAICLVVTTFGQPVPGPRHRIGFRHTSASDHRRRGVGTVPPRARACTVPPCARAVPGPGPGRGGRLVVEVAPGVRRRGLPWLRPGQRRIRAGRRIRAALTPGPGRPG